MPRRALKAIFSWALALVILFEEWGWEPLSRAVALLGRLPAVHRLEQRIEALPPYAALAAFFLPALAFLPVKIFALWLVAVGHAVSGILVIIAAKVTGTAIVARLFLLTKPSLMRLQWFERLYLRWTTWKDALLARVRASAAWRAIAQAKAQARALWRRLRRRASVSSR